ncbi:DNA repair protein rad16 [Rhizophlyctis rosea]|uniref:DNA repair protein rad16 n=1 Tax=Rhizophlyctis rosea TaxID=64517 RepID=A0AAD5SH67_9FUNG|nr:DNA repair protein rad16 [Rhizophlyctis rosea]
MPRTKRTRASTPIGDGDAAIADSVEQYSPPTPVLASASSSVPNKKRRLASTSGAYVTPAPSRSESPSLMPSPFPEFDFTPETPPRRLTRSASRLSLNGTSTPNRIGTGDETTMTPVIHTRSAKRAVVVKSERVSLLRGGSSLAEPLKEEWIEEDEKVEEEKDEPMTNGHISSSDESMSLFATTPSRKGKGKAVASTKVGKGKGKGKAPAQKPRASSASSSKAKASTAKKGKGRAVVLSDSEVELGPPSSDGSESEFALSDGAANDQSDESDLEPVSDASASDAEESADAPLPVPVSLRGRGAAREGRGAGRGRRGGRTGRTIGAGPSAAAIKAVFDDEMNDVEDASDKSEVEEDGGEAAAGPSSGSRRGRGRGGANGTTRRKAPKQKKEKKVKKSVTEHHPELITVWDQLEEEVKVIEPLQAEQPADVLVKLLPFQREGVYWMKAQEESRFAGGILADEMGMGKTIQMISLLVSRRESPNLILCPTVAILQWFAELTNRCTPNLFKILVFHGTNRPTSAKELASYDIVLSTYAIAEQGYRKENYGFKRKGMLVKEPSILHSIEWARVILDEAHAIKDRSCGTARAVFALKRKKQWSLSGTPLQNRVGELYSLIRFMDVDPFSYYFCKNCPCKMQTWSFSDRSHCDECGHVTHNHFCWWNAEILKPIQKYGAEGDGQTAFRKLGKLLDRIMLRRTKVERTEELGLPPRVVTVRRDVFNEAEEELYESLYSDSVRTFSTYVANDTVLNHYASIFSLLSRMRLAANHPDLVTTRMRVGDGKGAKENLVCGVCQEEAEDAVMSRCKHIFCREDARQYIQSFPEGENPTCPVCFKQMSIDLSQPEVLPKEGTETGAKQSIVNYMDLSKWRSSTKIEALVEELTQLRQSHQTEKSIVFSQFVAFLDLIQWRLSRAGFNVVKLDGRMAPQQRDTVIQKFMTDPEVTVFLVSLKAGGVALNLTEASRVFVMDPWWNPAVEDQAFDRIHRLGQYRPIKITRMIIENSIESRILQLQEKKKALFESTVGKDMDALAKLSEEDLQFLFVL